jgi:hypothetical protein
MAPFLASWDLCPAESVSVAAILKLTDLRLRSARRGLRASLACRTTARPAGTARLPRAITSFPSFRRLATFRVTFSWTAAVHGSLQVIRMGMRPRFTAR